MESKELLSSLSEETKKKLTECKTQKEMEAVLTEAGIDPLDDELLDAIAGGMRDPCMDFCRKLSEKCSKFRG